MSKTKSQTRTATHSQSPRRQPISSQAPPTVSGRWLASAIGMVLAGALLCVWGALCFLFWQGSWQLLYHPKAAITRTPAADGLAFEPVAFATTDTGSPRLQGWWIPAAQPGARTAIFFHGADGNLGETIDALAQLHAAGLNVFAFDYRGYGASQFVHPSQMHWVEDAESALDYLTGTRHLASSSILLAGNGLGANLALEIAAEQPDLAGVILDRPIADPTSAIFTDSRASLVPAHWLVGDRWDLASPAAGLHIPSLWFFSTSAARASSGSVQSAYQSVPSSKMSVWIGSGPDASTQQSTALARWLDALPAPPLR